jgi:hypothetical protein
LLLLGLLKSLQTNLRLKDDLLTVVKGEGKTSQVGCLNSRSALSPVLSDNKDLFRRLADCIPGAMNTSLAPGQVTAKEAAKAIALKDCLALLTADAVIIADSLGVVAKHMVRKWLIARISSSLLIA